MIIIDAIESLADCCVLESEEPCKDEMHIFPIERCRGSGKYHREIMASGQAGGIKKVALSFAVVPPKDRLNFAAHFLRDS